MSTLRSQNEALTFDRVSCLSCDKANKIRFQIIKKSGTLSKVSRHFANFPFTLRGRKKQ